jgi:PAP2 superfamily
MPDRILFRPFGPTPFKQLGRRILVFPALFLALCATVGGQTAAGPNPVSDSSSVSPPDAPLPQSADPAQASEKDRVTLRSTPINILKDQATIWTSPARIRTHDLTWMVPLAIATTVAITADHETMSSVVSPNAAFNNHNVTASDALTGGFIAAPVALLGIGEMRQNETARETGILGGEAIVDGLVVEEGTRLIFLRERPSVDQAKGKFFQKSAGVDGSFPSMHSVLAWSSASVIAAEYPSRLVRFSAYTLAAGVSLTRVLGQQHFPSDVLAGSAVGWLVGRYVYHRHHRVSED